MSVKKDLPRRSLRSKHSSSLAQGSTSAPLASVQPSPSSSSQSNNLALHLPPDEPSLSESGTKVGRKKRRKHTPSPTSSANTHNSPGRSENVPSLLEDAGVRVGPKTSRNRLIELLDKYVSHKRPRLTKTSRIRSTHEVRSKPLGDEEAHSVGPPLHEAIGAQNAPVLNDPVAAADYDFNNLEYSDLMYIVSGLGLDGKALPKDKLVVMCNQNRHLICLPSHMFRFAVPEAPAAAGALPVPEVSHAQSHGGGMIPLAPHSTSQVQTPTPPTQVVIPPVAGLQLFQNHTTGNTTIENISAPRQSKSPISQKRGSAENPLPPVSSEDSPMPLVLRSDVSPPCPLKSPISKERGKGKERAHSPAPSVSLENSSMAEPSGSSNIIESSEKSMVPNFLPSLEHRRFLHPRPNPTIKLLPTTNPKPTDMSDDDWLPPDDDTSSSAHSNGFDQSMIEDDSPSKSPGNKSAVSHASSLPPTHPQSSPTPFSHAPNIDEFTPVGESASKEDEDEPQLLMKYYQLKHSLAETNRRLEVVSHDLKVLTQVVSQSANVKPSPSPENKTKGGRSAHWIRLHIDILLGLPDHSTRLPRPATSEDQKAWRTGVALDNFDPCLFPTEPTPASTFDPASSDNNSPQHPKATSQQLSVMQTMMRSVGVSSFRPDFSKSPSSAENKWLWDLAFRIFIKLVECGEYAGVSLDEQNRKYLKKLLATRVRSLMKRYQQENWTETRKKIAASAVRRRARLSYTKKLRERIVLSQQSLWPLAAVVRAACSDDETDHEDCQDRNQQDKACHIRKLPWRSSQLTDIFVLLDLYKARLDASIPTPRKSSLEHGNPLEHNTDTPASNGRPPRPRLRCPNARIAETPAPTGLPIDCYSSQYLESLTHLERSALEIDQNSLLSDMIHTVRSLG